jgi:hypothetical protein
MVETMLKRQASVWLHCRWGAERVIVVEFGDELDDQAPLKLLRW